MSGIVAAFLFDRIVVQAFGAHARVASVWFALATVTNLVVGRVTFAAGVAVALAAILALQRGRPALAGFCAVLASLTSPLAGLFLATAAVGLGMARREHRTHAMAVGAVTLVPVLGIAVLFPSPGSFPYEPWALARDLAVCALVYLVVREAYPVLRWGCLAYAATMVGAFAVSSPVGGNVSRLAQYVAGPLLACVLLPGRRLLLAALAVPLVFWQWFPALDGMAYAQGDPSSHEAYYSPLIDYLESAPSVGRIEIPSTLRHWETAYIAPEIPLARGWERQTDIANNPMFYDGSLTSASYQTWLESNAVEFVALPDAPLDDSSLLEQQIILSRPSYLQPVWSSRHWQVWRVVGYRGLVEGPGRLVEQTPSSFTVAVSAPGDLVVRIHSSTHWATEGPGCVTSTPDGWTLIRGAEPGRLHVSQELQGTSCPDEGG
jgi:hypothetical protein